MPDRRFNVLFLCTGNSARSIMAECALNRWGKGRFNGFSAGSHPRGEVHPMALELLHQRGYETAGLRSKSWDEFAKSDSPRFDFVVTVCDNAADEICPVWPGQPITAHWSISDPAAFVGSEERKREDFQRAYIQLESFIRRFVNLPIDSLDRGSIARRAAEIGEDIRSTGGNRNRER
jgi:protein-tyrosine-phosphatase